MNLPMAIRSISQEQFERKRPMRDAMALMFGSEQAWFADSSGKLIGTVILDRTDKDWNYVILGPDHFGDRRYIDGAGSFADQETAEAAIVTAMTRIEKAGKVSEELFRADDDVATQKKAPAVFSDINEELKKYFAKHPEKLYDLSPRKFEELVASILHDFGFDVELTQATCDGGRDVIAYIRSAVTTFLTYVECKKYGPKNKVGAGIVKEVAGVHFIQKPHKSLIVTTSFFTKDAKEEARRIEHQLELKDYEDLKQWLRKYALP